MNQNELPWLGDEPSWRSDPQFEFFLYCEYHLSNNQNSLGLGASYIRNDGYTGVSLERMNHNYGIPTAEGGFIQQSQSRYDLAHQTNNPFDGFSSLKISAANTNYQHTEFTNNGIASTQWNNTATEARLELAHKQWLGSKGVIGAQVTGATLNAVTEALLLQLNQGVKLHDEPLPIAGKARALGSHQLEIVLEQGKYHQVKRMLAAVGNRVTTLHRSRIGQLALPSELAPGQWRWLSESERVALLDRSM